MTFKIIVEIKNAPIGSKIKSFLAKYLGDRSCPFKVKGLKVKIEMNLLEIPSHSPQDHTQLGIFLSKVDSILL